MNKTLSGPYYSKGYLRSEGPQSRRDVKRTTHRGDRHAARADIVRALRAAPAKAAKVAPLFYDCTMTGRVCDTPGCDCGITYTLTPVYPWWVDQID